MDREGRETGKCGFLSRIYNQKNPIVAEIPAWEEVSSSYSFLLLLFPFLTQIELQQAEAIDDQHISAREQVRIEKDNLIFALL